MPSPVLTRGIGRSCRSPRTPRCAWAGPADRLVEARSADEIVAALRAADAAGEPLLLLGGGSNVVIADEGVRGTALLVRSTGHRVEPLPDGTVLRHRRGGRGLGRPRRGATVDAGLGGLECLSGIPGSTGATPVQNVGAYGVEIADVLVDVDLYDRRPGQVRPHVPAAELGLGYRASALKHRDDAVVLRVRFRLRLGRAQRPDPLSASWPGRSASRSGRPCPRPPRGTPCSRCAAGKGMVLDAADHDTWSVGSFFTNPVLPVAEAPDLPGPRWPVGPDRVKLSAAWLIEHAGFGRGLLGPGGRVGLSGKHVLALSNRGGGIDRRRSWRWLARSATGSRPGSG